MCSCDAYSPLWETAWSMTEAVNKVDCDSWHECEKNSIICLELFTSTKFSKLYSDWQRFQLVQIWNTSRGVRSRRRYRILISLEHLQSKQRSAYRTPVDILNVFHHIVPLVSCHNGFLYFHSISLNLLSRFWPVLYALKGVNCKFSHFKYFPIVFTSSTLHPSILPAFYS